jgi:DUF438 domain-containing protein
MIFRLRNLLKTLEKLKSLKKRTIPLMNDEIVTPKIIQGISVAQMKAYMDPIAAAITYYDKDGRVSCVNSCWEKMKRSSGLQDGEPLLKCCQEAAKSELVQRTLRKMAAGKIDSATCWRELQGRMILIHYHAVRSRKNYLGVLEILQPVREFENVEGKRCFWD